MSIREVNIREVNRAREDVQLTYIGDKGAAQSSEESTQC
jgi:hypothetical protein